MISLTMPRAVTLDGQSLGGGNVAIGRIADHVAPERTDEPGDVARASCPPEQPDEKIDEPCAERTDDCDQPMDGSTR